MVAHPEAQDSPRTVLETQVLQLLSAGQATQVELLLHTTPVWHLQLEPLSRVGPE